MLAWTMAVKANSNDASDQRHHQVGWIEPVDANGLCTTELVKVCSLLNSQGHIGMFTLAIQSCKPQPSNTTVLIRLT